MNNNLKNNSYSSNYGAVTPVKYSENALLSKNHIFTDNSNKSGIYRWVNKLNNNTYVGSGLNLKKRVGEYFNQSELIRNPRPIHAALLKYGYENLNF